MIWLTRIRLRLAVLLHRERFHSELDEEIESHLEEQAEENLANGMSADEAQCAAARQFGNPTLLRETSREMWHWGWLDRLSQDLRYALRITARNPAFALVAILSLALGIGANTAVFTVVNAVLLRTLPVRNPQELWILNSSADAPIRNLWRRNSNDHNDSVTGQHINTTFPLAALRAFQVKSSDALDVFAFYSPGRIGVTDASGSRPANATLVSGNFFETLGVPMALGRGLVDADDQPGSTAIVVTGAFWERSLNSDASVLGRTLKLNGVAMTIVGVTAPRFHGVSAAGFDGPADIFGPLIAIDAIEPGISQSRRPLTAPDYWWLQIMARRRPGVTTGVASARLTSLYRGVLANSGLPTLQQAKNPRIILEPGDKGLDTLRETLARPLLLLMAIVGVVLLLACVNVATLQLARSATRRREIAVRLSLGAGRARIVRQLIVESLVLSLLGALAGSLMAIGGAPLIARLLTVTYDSVALNLSPDLRVLGFTLLASVLTGLVFGLAPAFRASHIDIAGSLKQSAQAAARRSIFAPGKFLIAGELALSLVLVAGSGLFLRTLKNLYGVDGGFAREHLLVFRLDAGQLGYRAEQSAPLFDRVLESVRATPAVISATAMSHPLISGWHDSTMLSSLNTGGQPADIWMNTVTPGFFETLGIPIVSGRSFSPRDDHSSPPVVILNQTAARLLFGNRPAVGQTLRRYAGNSVFPVEVVGVARDSSYASLRAGAPPTVFVPYQQDYSFTERSFAVRTTGDPLAMVAPIRRVVSAVQRDLVMMDVKTETRLIDESLHRERLFTTLLTLFAGFALLLSAIGLHGVTAYSVTRRTPEIGLRMALGASRHRVIGLVLGELLRPVAAGVILGLTASYAATRSIESLLFGVKRLDPATLALALLLLVAVALVAAVVPSWRAARTDPMTALRAE